MEIKFVGEFLGRIDEYFQFLCGGDKLFPDQMDGALQGIQEQSLLDPFHWVDQNSMDKLVLYFLFVVHLFDVFHGKGDVLHC